MFFVLKDGVFQDEQAVTTMETCNTVFTYVFIVEMVFKLIALGLKNYVVDPMNMFDGSIVLFSIADLMFLSGGNKAFSAFRSVRIFRY